MLIVCLKKENYKNHQYFAPVKTNFIIEWAHTQILSLFPNVLEKI